MNREQLLALGLTEEQVNSIMAMHGQVTQGLQNTISTNNTELQRLTTQLEQLQSQQQNQNAGDPPNTNEPSGESQEIIDLKNQIEQLQRENIKKDIRAYAAEKGLTGEQAEKVLSSFQDNLEIAKSAIDSLAQIISEKEVAAATAKEQEIANNSTNPGGGSAGNNDETKSTAEKIAEKMFGGQKQNNDILSHYVGGNTDV